MAIPEEHIDEAVEDEGSGQHLAPLGGLIAGKYRVERVLGRGQMGLVLAATHVELLERRAVKVMLPEATAIPGAGERFLREARAGARLRSEHVARVLDLGRLEDGTPFLVMEHLEGTDLFALAHGRKLPVADVALWALQICEALAEAHALGIVHRDLKPANLFLTRRRDGTPCVKVLDFGLSKVLTEGGHTTEGRIVGSPLYVSPEQARGTGDVTAQADVWSLGAILYELCTGRSPFGGESLVEVLLNVLNLDPPAPSELAPELPAALDAVVLRCLERDRGRRHPDVGALARDLAPFAPGGKALAERVARVLAEMRWVPGESVESRPLVVENHESLRAHVDLPATGREGEPSDLDISLAIVHQDDVSTLFSWRSLLVVVWHHGPTASSVPALEAAIIGVARHAPHGVIFCALISTTSVMPEAEGRDAARRALKRLEPNFVATVNAVLGTGFHAAGIRAVIAGLHFIHWHTFPKAVVADIREAARFIVRHWPPADAPAPNPRALEVALREAEPR